MELIQKSRIHFGKRRNYLVTKYFSFIHHVSRALFLRTIKLGYCGKGLEITTGKGLGLLFTMQQNFGPVQFESMCRQKKSDSRNKTFLSQDRKFL